MAKGFKGYRNAQKASMGGGMNMQSLMQQAQQMQSDLEVAKEEISAKEIIGSAGGEMVTVTLTGDKIMKGISINQDVVDPEDVEMLEDLIMAAWNDASKKVDAFVEEKMPETPAGLGGLI